VWSAGGVVRKRYTAPAPVLQVRRPSRRGSANTVAHARAPPPQLVWSRFLDGAAASEPYLCLLHAGLLSLFSPSGAPPVLSLANAP